MPRTATCGVLIVVSLYLLYGYRLGARDLWSSHEARAAMDAHSLLHGPGPVGVPYLFDGTPELQKPPLYYALAATAGALRGEVDAVAVRLPAALSAVGCVALLGGWLAFARGRPVLGLLAATVLATGVHFTLLARTGRIDMPLALATLAAVLGFVEAARGAGRGWLVLAYVAVAAGVLLKGPVAVALVAAVLVPWWLLDRLPSPPGFAGGEGLGVRGEQAVRGEKAVRGEQAVRGENAASPRAAVAPLTPTPLPPQSREARGFRALLRRWEPWWGLPLVALLVVPWLAWIDAATDGTFFRVFLWEHNVERGLGTGRLRTYPGWYYAPLLGVNFLPWSPVLLVAVVVALVRRWHRVDSELRVGLAGLAGMLGLLSLVAFKRADYLAPLYPFAAVGVAVLLERGLARLSAERCWRLAVSGCVGALLLAGVGQAVYAHTELARVEPRREQATFAATVRTYAGPGEPVVQFRTECHLLAFHLGPGRAILREWPDLADRVRRAGSLLVALPPGCVDELSHALPEARRERLADNGRHDRPLVLVRLASPP